MLTFLPLLRSLIFLETSGQILKRKMDEDPQYISPSKKIRIEEGWREYRASDGKMVTLPPSWIAMLEDSRYLPKPRNEFEHLKDDLKAGSWVDIPSLGQVPKGYRVSEILVTHQMLELWNEMEEEQRCGYFGY
ncbi:hypothetical protein BCR41DRAFT_385565 [Lobosporangium transversale]|uniref:Uncharacterized protein n=1 Tax=Lobosporangium transversale TaxID=64571 RepID=A0A1Y2GTB3_9FUNG|nr:hypothetical protein BCR41DRAFT_385565 [Lobosporangium transversale]ORZ19970.1 hypothetical protein BCR41DRAFT_385565 [Lobosporangium transversale]|eukprot:XP_021882510.1 hypothetical protein BCR41DRAFT_385565 [Lobosporangium transversale]